MKKLYFLSVIAMIFLISACTVEPAQIAYGNDACQFCKMTIVEETHAAQIVTKKGKPFKYDAIECLLNDLENHEEKDIALFLVTDYVAPTTLIDATTANFLISKSIQSPMGANLTAFKKMEDAQKLAKNESDKILNWIELQEQFSK